MDPDGPRRSSPATAAPAAGHACCDRGPARRVGRAGRARALDVADLPVALGGLARHNVANALAAAGGARAMGATREQVADGLRDFRPSADLSPGRLNLFRLGRRTVIVDFAHNEAGTEAIMDVAEAIAGGRGAAGRTAARSPRSSAPRGDRPDDTLRGIGRIAARRRTAS